MKRFAILFSLLFSFAGLAFSQAYESQVTYDKKKQKTISCDYAYPQEAVENAIVKKIQDLGHTGKEEKGIFNKDKGYIVFKDATIPDISDQTMDYIIKVDRKSRKEKDESTLNIVMSKNGEDATPSMSAHDIGMAKLFLNNLIPDIEEANLELQIKDQEGTVSKSEKKYKDLQDEKSDLEKKLKKNGDDIENQTKQIESQRQALDLMKGKRRVQPEAK